MMETWLKEVASLADRRVMRAQVDKTSQHMYLRQCVGLDEHTSMR
jgi:hypothetical protein